jgi:hypothetical protein
LIATFLTEEQMTASLENQQYILKIKIFKSIKAISVTLEILFFYNCTYNNISKFGNIAI